MKVVQTKKRDFEFLALNKINTTILKKIKGGYGGGTTGANDDTPANK